MKKFTKVPFVQCKGEEISAHPQVYLKINPCSDSVICPYCNTQFVLTRTDNTEIESK